MLVIRQAKKEIRKIMKKMDGSSKDMKGNAIARGWRNKTQTNKQRRTDF